MTNNDNCHMTNVSIPVIGTKISDVPVNIKRTTGTQQANNVWQKKKIDIIKDIIDIDPTTQSVKLITMSMTELKILRDNLRHKGGD